MFGDLTSAAGLKKLNDYLVDKSYIEGYQPSQADTGVFNGLKAAPAADYSHALRWYNHIKSYGNEKSRLRWFEKGSEEPIVDYLGARFYLCDLMCMKGLYRYSWVSLAYEWRDTYSFPGSTGSSAAKAPKVEAKKEEKDEDDIDLFGSDDEVDEAAERLKQERLAAYEAKKATKTAIIAKSNIVLDVKPWDDETDMAQLEACVRSVQCDGLLWGASKLVPLAYGIKKLQITCVVEDDKVGTDFLEEEITKFEDVIQSVDIAAFNKI